MTGVIATIPRIQFSNALGLPLAGGKLYTYLAGTTTPVATYQDQDLTTANENPIQLDSTGSCTIWLDPAKSYKFTLKSVLGITQPGWPVDNISGASNLISLEPTLGLYAKLTALAAAVGSSLIGFIQAAVGAVARTVQDKLRDTVSVKDFGVVGDGSDEYVGITAAWNYALSAGKSLHFPAGVYSCGANNFPFKNPAYPATSILDCGNISIFGDGPATVLKTVSAAGTDVINLYFVKNLHFRNLMITADLTGSAGSGSNGISIVGGFDNLSFDGIKGLNLPYVDKGTYLDGGKAFTIQPGTPAADCGTIKVTRFTAIGCVYGAGLEVDLVNWATKKHAIDIDLVAENCYQGVVFSAGAATGAMSAGMTMGYRVRAQLVNCQRSVIVARAHGVNIEANIVTTLSAAARRLNPTGSAWATGVTTVDGLLCTYAKNSRIALTGDLGGCDYKAQIGGASAGSSGMLGTTDSCDFYFDIGGTSGTADFNLVDSGGNNISNCQLFATAGTFSAIPTVAYTPAQGNTITVGSAQRVIDMLVADELRFTYTDGVSVFHKILRNGLRMDFSASGSSSATNINYGFLKHDGTLLAGFRNDGFMITQGRITAASVATVKQVMPIYDNTNTLVGYVPIYTTYA